VTRLADVGEATRALDVAERARARAFADLVASRVAQRAPMLATRAASTAVPLPTGLALRGTPDAPRGGTRLDSAVDVRSATVDEMVATARTQRTTIVSYWVDENVTRAWVVTPAGDIHMQRLPIGQADLQRAIAATAGTPAAGTFAAGPAARAAFRRLHDELVAPLRRWLPPREELVTVVPHGPLFRLSFAALTDRRGRYLIEDYQISYTPSVTVLRLLHDREAREGPPSYLLVGDPALPVALVRTHGFTPLPGAAQEVNAIRRFVAPASITILRRTQASESSVRRAAATAGVVHLATHAITDDARPFESFLALAADGAEPEQDGRLTAEDIYDLWLDADLVVLSACRSAAGPVTGDGLLGLTRAFFASGTRSMIATLWDLPDEAARAILPRFYREWIATGSKARALRRAQLAWLADLRANRVTVDSSLGRVTLVEHPALWASLVLQGRP
jgi:CHAT domain-containing protein